MSVSRILFLMVLALASVALATAQAKTPAPTATPTKAPASTSNSTLTIEELYLSQEVEVQLLRTQASANNRDSKLLALQDIQGMIDQGKVTQDSKEVVTILEALAGEGVYRETRTNGVVSNDFPDVRRSAVELLGKVGGKASFDILTKVLLNDKEPMVQAQAIYALGTVPDVSKESLKYIAEVLHNNSARQEPDENLAMSGLLSLEKISGKVGGVNDPEVINEIIVIAFNNQFPKIVQNRAKKLLEIFRTAK